MFASVLPPAQCLGQSDEDQRVAVPADEEIQEQIQAVKNLKKDAGNRATALMEFISENELSPIERYIVLNESLAQAIQDGDSAAWKAARDIIVSDFKIDQWTLSATGLVEFAKKHPSKFLASKLFDFAIEIGDESSRNKDFEKSVELMRQLLSAVRGKGIKANLLRKKRKQYEELGTIYSLYETATLEQAKPSPDTRTNAYLGIWQLVGHRDWDKACMLFAECPSDQFRDFRSAAFAERAGDLTKAAEVWRGLADRKRIWLVLRQEIARHSIELLELEIASESSVLIKKDLESDLAEFKLHCYDTLGILHSDGNPYVPAVLRNRMEPGRSKTLSEYSVSANTTAAIQLGLQWLSRVQHDDGGWKLSGPYLDGASFECRNAATAMALLAFLGDGQTHKHGEYQGHVNLGLRFLVKMQTRDGAFAEQEVAPTRLSYANAMATLALCEAYALTQDQWIRPYAQAAIDNSQRCQSSLGGWRYEARADSDTSVTGWYVSALVMAKYAKLDVDEAVFEAANTYLDTVMDKDSESYSYLIGGKATPSASVIGIACRAQLGWRKEKSDFDSAANRWTSYYATSSKEKNVYAMYYASQIASVAGGKIWNSWNQTVLNRLTDYQRRSGSEVGSWDPVDDKYGGAKSGKAGRLFQTCFSLLCLESSFRNTYSQERLLKPTTDSKERYALVLSGGGYIRTPLTYSGDTPITVEAIVSPTSPTPEGTIVGNFDNAGLGRRLIGSKWDFLWHNKGRYISVSSGVKAEPGRRVHVAAVSNGQQIAIFTDGVLRGVTKLNGHKVSRLKFLIGADPGPRNEPQHRFNGVYNFLRISPVARYTSNFRAPASLENDRNTVLLYDFTRRQEGRVHDESGHGNDGTLHGAAWIRR